MRDDFPRPRQPLRTPPHVVLAHRLLRAIAGLLFRLDVKGSEHIPRGQPYCLAANHISRFDPLLLLAVFPLRPRIWFLAASGPTIAVPWRRRLLGITGGIIPIYEGDPRSGKRALRDAQAVVRAGGIVGIFPEGRVGSKEGVLQPVKPGAAKLSLRTGVPILPVWLAGTRRVYWRKRIQMIIGEPFYPPAGVPMTTAAAEVAAALWACSELAEPVPEPERPPGLWLNRLL